MDSEMNKSKSNGIGNDGHSIYIYDEVIDLLSRFGKRGDQIIKDFITQKEFGQFAFSNVCVTEEVEYAHDEEGNPLYRPKSKTGRTRVEISEKLYAKVDTVLSKRKDAQIEDVVLPRIKQWLDRSDRYEMDSDGNVYYDIKSGRTLKKLKPYIIHFGYRGSNYHILVDWKDSHLTLRRRKVRAGMAGANTRLRIMEDNEYIESSTDHDLEMS